MNEHRRMSPVTAFFLGLFGTAGVTVLAAAAVVLFGMRIAEQNIVRAFSIADHTVDRLPELVDSLPESVKELLNDRRAPEYARHIAVEVRFREDDQRRTVYPAVSITNNGDEVVSLLGLRVVALSPDGVPEYEWTEVAATPLALSDNDWRGLLFPHGTRHMVLYGYRGPMEGGAADLRGSYEISELRLWNGGTDGENVQVTTTGISEKPVD